MNVDICPTITAATNDEFQTQMETIAQFAHRVHIDIADGTLTPNTLMTPSDVWWPGGVRADLHVMSKQPLRHLETLIDLRPQLIIVHADADGDFMEFARIAHEHGIETGVALMPSMPPEMVRSGLSAIDHVLIFSGQLGSFGGTVDLHLASKITALKAMKPTLEIGWDGGVKLDNARQLVQAGAQVLNVGGFIHHSGNPAKAFAMLDEALDAAAGTPHTSPAPKTVLERLLPNDHKPVPLASDASYSPPSNQTPPSANPPLQ